jgi:hypothetical protein
VNPNEGVRRIKLLGSRIMWYGCAVGVALWLMALIPLAMAGRASVGLGELVFFLGFPLFAGGIIRVFAWIIEGFVLPGNPDRSETD